MGQYDDLINHLKKRVWEEADRNDAGRYAGPPRPPLTPERMEQAEQLLGFRLPCLVRRLYLEVADGFWGPGYGLTPLLDEIDADNGSVVDTLTSAEKWGLPTNSMPLCSFGCGYDVHVKYDDPELPIICTDLSYDDNPSGYLQSPPGCSLSNFLQAWLEGGNRQATACLYFWEQVDDARTTFGPE